MNIDNSMRQKEQNKPKPKRSDIPWHIQSAQMKHQRYLYRSGQIPLTPELTVFEERVKQNREENRRQEEEKYKKIWENVKLEAGQVFLYFSSSCLRFSSRF